MLDCQYRITVGPNDVIKIVFEDFETEYNFDYIELFDGNSTNSTYLGRYSGSLNLNSMHTSSNQLFIKFITDRSNTFRGFKINYSRAKDEGKKNFPHLNQISLIPYVGCFYTLFK